MADGHCFISYSSVDGLEFATKLANELEGGYPFINVWFDKRDLRPGMDWDVQIDEALKACKLMLFVMTVDSTNEKSVCKQEMSRALSYKKPIIPIYLHRNSQSPFRLGDRQRIDFTSNFDAGLGQLRRHIAWMASPEGQLQALKDRLLDAERDLQRSRPEDQPRVQADIEDLKKQIDVQQKIVDDPQAAQEQTQKNIEAGLERERQPVKPTAAQTSTKFINPPPGIAPTYFQDRMIETEQVVKFLRDDAQRLMTIVGRGGVGKTAMVCRLLKGLEAGELPDGLGAMKVKGIVYLSESGSHRVNFANLFYDLSKLLSHDVAQELDTIYKNPQGSTESKMRALLEKFSDGGVVLLLDNFEPLVDMETFVIRDTELDEALRSLLTGTHTSVNVIITTRIAPQVLNRKVQPGRQRILDLDDGLELKYACKMLREMDADGKLGLKRAKRELLNLAHKRTLGYPRALEALFAILASDRYTSLEDILATAENYLPDEVVEALVGEAFNRLDTNAQKVMQALAVYNRPVTPAAVDYLLAPHLPAMDSASILQRLANMHFARKESGRFYLHPVDREFAFGLIPVEDLTAKSAKDAKVVEEKPETEEDEALREIQRELDALKSSRSLRASRFDAFTQHDLTSRAADYFAQARKPRAEWKKLDDLSAQLAEFELRCAAGDYDNAARVLVDIDFDYLHAWGHYRLSIDLRLRIKDEITDTYLRADNLNGLGLTFHGTGKINNCIEFYQQGLDIATDAKDRGWESVLLGNLGFAYLAIGDAHKAIELYKKGLIIKNEIGDRRNKPINLENTGHAFLMLGEFERAKDYYIQAIQIADEILYTQPQLEARWGLSQSYLFQNDLVNARAIIESTLQYDAPEYNHDASALHGIIVLRQGDEVAARGAFVRAIRQADEILSKTAEYYSALDAKGLALSGLAILDDDGRGGQPSALTEAIEMFKQARKIAPHAGVVKSVLRLFDELAKCDQGGVLKEVRKVIEGS